MDKLTKESDWAEWKEKCAFGLCCEEAQARLGKFCSQRLFKSLGTDAKKKLSQELEIDQNEDFKTQNSRVLHFLDTQFIIEKEESEEKGKEKKFLKDWMISVSPNHSHIEATATNLIRDLKKKLLLKISGREFTNYSKGRKVGEEGLTLDVLAESNEPNPADEIKFKELEEELIKKAEQFFSDLSKDRKVAFFARYMKRPLHHPAVLKASGKGRSALYANLNSDIASFAEVIQNCESLEKQPMSRLQGASLNILEKVSIEWGKNPENGCLEILKESDD